MGPTVNVAQFVSNAIEASGKTRAQIAEETGLESPNVLSMINKGQTKLPLNRVSAFAQALGVDAKSLMSHALHEYMPETWMEIQRIYGFAE